MKLACEQFGDYLQTPLESKVMIINSKSLVRLTRYTLSIPNHQPPPLMITWGRKQNVNRIVQPSEVRGPSKESEGSTRLNQAHLGVLVPCARVLAPRIPRELIQGLKQSIP